jgi:cell fate regulator YaaT (PSP1 superfamily)
MDAIDDGWGDSSESTSDSVASTSTSTDVAGSSESPDPAKRRKRRRRRGGGGGNESDDAPTNGSSEQASQSPSGDVAPSDAQPRDSGRANPGRGGNQPQQQRRPQADANRSREGRADRGGKPASTTNGGERAALPGNAGQRGPSRNQAANANAAERERGPSKQSGEANRQAASQRQRPEPTGAQSRAYAAAAELRTAPVAVPQRRDDNDDPDQDAIESTSTDGPWGIDDDSPIKPVVFAADLAVDDAAATSPSTANLATRQADLSGAVCNVTAVRFTPNGRIAWFDAGAMELAAGIAVIVDSERGPRTAMVAVPPQRRVVRDRNIRRVISVATASDHARDEANAVAAVDALRIAKDRAAALKLPLKVFRAEYSGGKLFVYFTTDERVDVRELLRQLTAATNARVELRQLGVRDEAKAVGGIGSCGLTLCCTTWLPDFVPVSIKMAKDQGLVLNPSKVSGQCGRLKCCLVYEQAGYAEMRKGLPKLGKRVVSPRGEGRVVEVDVLRQRIRVSYGHGESEMLPAVDVKPLFPSGNQARQPNDDDDDDNDDTSASAELPTT